MPTHNQLAGQLLRDAAAFFETIAEQNEPLRAQMMENAAVFREVGHLVETDPLGEIHAHGGEGGGCCGGHGHSHDDDEEGDESCADKGKKENCDGHGGCGCH